MLQVKVNDASFEIDGDRINGTETDYDLLDLKDGTFHLIKNNKSYRCALISADYESKEFIIKVNGQEMTLQVKDKYDLLLEKLGMNNLASSKVNQIKAPMPGLVLDVKVGVGDSISKGDAVVVLEAMKMENMIKAPGDGTIKKINVKKGEAVEKNQVMIELD